MRSNARLSLVALPGGAALPIRAGDVVRTGSNFHPHYRVIAVTGDRAWIRDIQYGSDHVVPIERCRTIENGGL